MFAAAKTGKFKPPGAKTNSREKLLTAIKTQPLSLKLQKLKKNDEPKKTEFILLPPPRPNQQNVSNKNNTKIVKSVIKQNAITKRSLEQRLILGMTALLGKVDFCLSMHKKYPDADAIWDVYGKVNNIKQGKSAEERILLLRNEQKGAVMQAICKKTEEESRHIEIGAYVRVVGRFIGINRFNCYTVDEINADIWQHCFKKLHETVEKTLQNLAN